MYGILFLSMLGQTAVGPLDGFRANLASIRADVDYTYEFGTADQSTAEGGRLWNGEVVGFEENRSHAVIGRWSYDGSVERYESKAPEDALRKQRSRVGNGEIKPFVTEPFELIFDGYQTAYHTIKGESVDRRSDVLVFQRQRAPAKISDGGSPFFWWGLYRFPIVIEEEFNGAQVERVRCSYNGYLCESEIYSLGKPAYGRLEVHFDPSIGHVPRYARVIGPIHGNDRSVKEMYMIAAKPCAAGGFVPVEWYDVSYIVENFARRYPSYSYETVLHPSGRRIAVGHYKAVRMTDRKKPVALEKLAGITRISSDGGEVALTTVPDHLSLADVEARLAKVLAHPKPLPPTVDVDEIRKFAGGPDRLMSWYLVLGACVILLSGLALGLRALRRRAALLLLTSLSAVSSGCARPADSPPRLTAEVSPGITVYPPDQPMLHLTLTIRNLSPQSVKILQASGGCSCRAIDQHPFPVKLNRGGSVSLAITVRGDRSYEPAAFHLALSTDQGIIELPARYLALPRFSLIPESINLGTLTDEEQESSFEIVQRQVFQRGTPRADLPLQVPPEFDATCTGTRETAIIESSALHYVDKTYRLTLKHKQYGLSKAVIQQGGGNGAAEASVVWRRVPYLSTTPARLYLGARPLRVFLRCPDEKVELTRVISAPRGVRAFVSSPREVTVMAEAGAPGMVNDVVEVGTTAKGRPPLSIPVVRYAPPAAEAGPRS